MQNYEKKSGLIHCLKSVNLNAAKLIMTIPIKKSEVLC
ncbi:hypothetical protein NBC122_00536 [Chryseobacterium salivictor]|uniref:Uncharacterized protein n=1 Tax=Chryseobacterium salivictor TaxID=2547600 RepID=A0A4P6ZD81_9FLAO|nr:hypothetical protein NBC122_00536 [Chryseobacterium salivictor]